MATENRVRLMVDELVRSGKKLTLNIDDLTDDDMAAFEGVADGMDLLTYSEMIQRGEIDLERAIRKSDTRKPFIAFVWVLLRARWADVTFDEVRTGLGLGRLGTVIEFAQPRPTANTVARVPDAMNAAGFAGPLKPLEIQ